MKPSELAERALDLIRDEARWTQGTYHRDALDEMLMPDDVLSGRRTAARHCSLGALLYLTNGSSDRVVLEYMVKVVRELSGSENAHIADFNDTNSHSAVVAMWEKTIAGLQEGGN